MSVPSFPVISPALTRADSINQILSSIAYEELGMSHIINSEGEKIQFVLGTLPGLTGGSATYEDVLAVNESVQGMLSSSLENQLLLNSKMGLALNAPVIIGATGPTAPYIIGNYKTARYKGKKIKYELSHYTGYRP